MDYRGNFIDGAFVPVEAHEGVVRRENPCRSDEIVFEAPWSTAAVEAAVEAARRAQPGWDRLGLEGRRLHLERAAQVFEARRDELARAIARETGKPLWEAQTEAGALSAKIAIMSTEGASRTAEVRPDGLSGGLYRYRPLGVLAVLGPFNFPLHLPNGHIVPGLLNGNTVVVKPSELTGGTMQLYLECLQEAGLPPGVVNMVHGPGPVGAALAGHRGVDGVLFTGSYETGMRIKRATLEHHWKLLALEMGGKNTSVILDDADLDQAVHEVALAAYLTTGQRCSATSRVVVHDAIADAFLERFAALSRRVTTGDAFADDPFMGPLVSRPAFERFLAAQADDEGGKLRTVLKGGAVEVAGRRGYYVSPAVWEAVEADARGSHQAQEIFGPDVVVYRAADEAEALRLANATEYGLAISVFTADEERFERLSYDLQAGIVNMNRSTCGASSRLPFGGVKKSGNQRASALFAGQYCTYPQAQLRQEAGWNASAADAGALGRLAAEVQE